MKIAIISDIHGNLLALQAVLENIQKENCEKIFCLGDLAMAGPQPAETIDFIKSQKWEIIQGNTDKMIAEFSDEILNNVKSNFPIMGNALENDVKLLNQEQKDFLKNLPNEAKITINGIKIHLVHGSPRRNNEDILPNLPINEIEEIIKNSDCDLIFCGHTHIPCGYQTTKKQTVVNVGSVGRPFTDNAKPCYVILEINANNEFNIEHRFIDYEKENSAKILGLRNFEGSEKLSEILINPQKRHL